MNPLQELREIAQQKAALKSELAERDMPEALRVAIHQQLASLSALAAVWAKRARTLDTRSFGTHAMDGIKDDPIAVGLPVAGMAFSASFMLTWWYMHTRHYYVKGWAYNERQIGWRRNFLKIDVITSQFPEGVVKITKWSFVAMWLCALVDSEKRRHK
jgi:hypothetical protein